MRIHKNKRLLTVALLLAAALPVHAASKPKPPKKPDLPPTPEQLAAITFTSKDPRLNDWLTTQSTAHPHEEATPDQLKELDAILDQTTLPALDLMTLAHNYRLKTTTLLVPRDIYRTAETKWEAELAKAANDPKQTRVLLDTFAKNRQKIKDVLLTLLERQPHDPIATDTLQKYYSGFLKYLLVNDRKMISVAQGIQSGLAETYFMQGKNDDALSILQEAAEDSTLSGSRWESNEWLMIEILDTMKKYPEAIDRLQKDIDNPKRTDRERQEAYGFLFRIAIDSHRPDLAQSTLDTWSTKYPMPDQEKKSLQSVIAQASHPATTKPAATAPAP